MDIILIIIAAVLVYMFILNPLILFLLGEKGLKLKPTTKKLIGIYDTKSLFKPRIFLHGYWYLTRLKNYVWTGRTAVKVPFIGPAGTRWLVGKSYHGKTMTLDQIKALVTINKDIPLQDVGEKVIPFPVARNILLNASPDIAIMECPCRHTSKNPCQPTQVCMAVGQPFVDFMLEHNPKTTKKITQQEAVELLQAEHERGHMHTAWFKDALADRFWAICNCCSCCCTAMDLMKKNIDVYISSGYVAKIDGKKCNLCLKCVKKCPVGALQMGQDSAELIWEKCKGCGVCVDMCPQKAIVLERDERKGEPLEVEKLFAKG